MKFFLAIVLLVTAVCGAKLGSSLYERTNDFSTRVVGGQNAYKGQYKSIVSLQASRESPFMHICGGIIISPNYVVTAGHCYVGPIPQYSYRIVAGIDNLDNINAGQIVNVTKFIVNPLYEGGVASDDIAILVLAKPILFNQFVQMAKLPVANSIPSGDVKVAGWGSTSNTSTPSMPKQLQTTVLTVLTFGECKNALIRLTGSSAPLNETNVCTGPLTGGKGACSGDSGGPIYQGETVIGIASWTFIPCGNKGIPTVWVRVSAYIDFIKKHVHNLP